MILNRRGARAVPAIGVGMGEGRDELCEVTLAT